MGNLIPGDLLIHGRPPYPWETSSLETWLSMGELFQGDIVIHGRPPLPGRPRYPWETSLGMVPPFPPESSWDIQEHSQQEGWDIQDEKQGWKEPGFGTAVQGCLSIKGEQMGPEIGRAHV